MTDDAKAKKAKAEERLKKAQYRITISDAETWIIQGNPKKKKNTTIVDGLYAWPANYAERRRAPASVEFNPGREHRKYSVVILDKVKSNRRPAVYRPISRMHYESMLSAIAAAIKHKDKIEKIIADENVARAA